GSVNPLHCYLSNLPAMVHRQHRVTRHELCDGDMASRGFNLRSGRETASAFVVNHKTAGDERVWRADLHVENSHRRFGFRPAENGHWTEMTVSQCHDAFARPALTGVPEMAVLHLKRMLHGGSQFTEHGLQNQQPRAGHIRGGDNRRDG